MSTATSDHNLKEYVTAMIGGQLFGLPILRLQDVFAPDRLTRVPLAPAIGAIAGGQVGAIVGRRLPACVRTSLS